MAGMDGYPDQPPVRQIRIRLCLASTGRVLVEADAPQSASARKLVWELGAGAGQQGYFELVDGNDGGDAAWVACGDFRPALPELEVPDLAPRDVTGWLVAAAGIAVRVEARDVAPQLAALALPGAGGRLRHEDPEVIDGVTHAWQSLDPGGALAGLLPVLRSGSGPAFYRERVAQLFIGQGASEADAAILTAMKGLPQRAQERLAYPLASNPSGAELLLTGMENGAISPRVLQRVGVNNRLRVSKPRDWESRVAKLKARLPAEDDARDRLLTEFKGIASSGTGDATRGRGVFGKNCAVCHRIGDLGALVGPQLDGIGQRGVDRLCEDILDPNRAVDRAFRVTLFTTRDQEVVSGLVRREEGELIVLADSTGKEFTLPKRNVQERRESETSLMPDNFGELLSKGDFADLMAFLASTALDHGGR